MKRTVYRIVPEGRTYDAFSGEGARLYPGRWNHRGVPMVYCAESIALAALEMLVHADSLKLLERYMVIPVSFEERACSELRLSDLPSHWSTYPSPASTKDCGTAWVTQKKSALLAVPSAVIPAAKNYLINPLHPGFKKLVIGKPAHFSFDRRLGGNHYPEVSPASNGANVK